MSRSRSVTALNVLWPDERQHTGESHATNATEGNVAGPPAKQDSGSEVGPCWPSAAQHGETHCVERHGTDAMAAAQAQQGEHDSCERHGIDVVAGSQRNREGGGWRRSAVT